MRKTKYVCPSVASTVHALQVIKGLHCTRPLQVNTICASWQLCYHQGLQLAVLLGCHHQLHATDYIFLRISLPHRCMCPGRFLCCADGRYQAMLNLDGTPDEAAVQQAQQLQPLLSAAIGETLQLHRHLNLSAHLCLILWSHHYVALQPHGCLDSAWSCPWLASFALCSPGSNLCLINTPHRPVRINKTPIAGRQTTSWPLIRPVSSRSHPPPAN